VRSYEQAQETAISDGGHGKNGRSLDGCIDAAERSDRRGSIDPIEQVINARSGREQDRRLLKGCSVRGCWRPGAAEPAAGSLRQGARLWSARATSETGVPGGGGVRVELTVNPEGQVERERWLEGAPSGRPAVVVVRRGATSLARTRARVRGVKRVGCLLLLRGAQRPGVLVVGGTLVWVCSAMARSTISPWNAFHTIAIDNGWSRPFTGSARIGHDDDGGF
jgi:hypothetical protein